MISFSGIDCAGKSTQIKLIADRYERIRGIKCKMIWARVGFTPFIRFVKKLARLGKRMSEEDKIEYSRNLHKNNKKLSKLYIDLALMDLWFYYTFYVRFVEIFEREVICDRYIWDAYVDIKILNPDYDFKHSFWWKALRKTAPVPKTRFLMLVPVEESLRRENQKQNARHETEEMKRRRIEIYQRLEKKGHWLYTLDGTLPTQELHELIAGLVP